MVDTCTRSFRPSVFAFAANRTALIVAEPQTPIANLFSENPIFLHQIFDDVLLMLVHPSRERSHKQ